MIQNKNLFTIHIAYKPPFDWESLLQYYSNHQIPFIEEVKNSTYQRIFKIDSTVGHLYIKNDALHNRLELEIYSPDVKVVDVVVNRVRKMFDLDSDPLVIQKHFASSPFLSELWNEFPGLRIARGWDTYEIVVATILGQVISVKQATYLMGVLVQNYGEKVIHPLTQQKVFLFPAPEVLANTALQEVKITTQRKNAIIELSKQIITNSINFMEDQDINIFKKKLMEIKGIGNWSAEYICLRAIGDRDAFPANDLIIQRALQLNRDCLDASALKPWRGYLTIYLWRKYAELLSKQKKKKEQS